MLRCSECKKPLVEETRYMDWLKLMHFMEFLYSENYIEQSTRDSMTDALMTMKDWAFEGNDG